MDLEALACEDDGKICDENNGLTGIVSLHQVKETLLSKALTCMNCSCINQNGYFIKETDTFG